MKLSQAFVVVTLCTAAHANPPSKTKSQPPSFQMRAGNDVVKRTPKEKYNDVMRQLTSLSEKEVDDRVFRAAQAELRRIRGLVPSWCNAVPDSIMFYIDFSANDSLATRAYRFVHLGLKLRDMYEDLPINRDVFLTYPTPAAKQLSTSTRYHLVARSYLNAYALLASERETLNLNDDDTIASLAEVGRWALYYDSIAAKGEEEFVEAATGMAKLAQTFLGNAPSPKVLKHAQLLLDDSLKTIVNSIANVMSAHLHLDKSTRK